MTLTHSVLYIAAEEETAAMQPHLYNTSTPGVFSFSGSSSQHMAVWWTGMTRGVMTLLAMHSCTSKLFGISTQLSFLSAFILMFFNMLPGTMIGINLFTSLFSNIIYAMHVSIG